MSWAMGKVGTGGSFCKSIPEGTVHCFVSVLCFILFMHCLIVFLTTKNHYFVQILWH